MYWLRQAALELVLCLTLTGAWLILVPAPTQEFILSPIICEIERRPNVQAWLPRLKTKPKVCQQTAASKHPSLKSAAAYNAARQHSTEVLAQTPWHAAAHHVSDCSKSNCTGTVGHLAAHTVVTSSRSNSSSRVTNSDLAAAAAVMAAKQAAAAVDCMQSEQHGLHQNQPPSVCAQLHMTHQACPPAVLFPAAQCCTSNATSEHAAHQALAARGHCSSVKLAPTVQRSNTCPASPNESSIRGSSSATEGKVQGAVPGATALSGKHSSKQSTPQAAAGGVHDVITRVMTKMGHACHLLFAGLTSPWAWLAHQATQLLVIAVLVRNARCCRDKLFLQQRTISLLEEKVSLLPNEPSLLELAQKKEWRENLHKEMNAVHFGTKAACHQMTEIVQRCWFENVCWPTEQDRTTQVVTGEQLPTGAVEPGMQDQAA